MKLIRKILITSILLLAVLVLPSGNLFHMRAEAGIPTYYVEKGKKLKVSINISGKKTWTSSKKSVATVTSNGIVKAKKVGSAVIKVKVRGKVYSCKVVVPKKSSKNIARLLEKKIKKMLTPGYASPSAIAILTNGSDTAWKYQVYGAIGGGAYETNVSVNPSTGKCKILDSMIFRKGQTFKLW